MLCDIIDYTYDSNTKSDLLKKYKLFYLEYSNKISSTDSSYSWKNHKIIVRNLFQDDSILLYNTLRSLAHHIDFRNRGKSNNDWQYFAEFERLLRSSIKMGLITFLQIKDIPLSDKEEKIIYKLEQEGVLLEEKYKSDSIIIRVSNCYQVRDKLKSHKYVWLSNEKVWEIEINQNAVSDELSFLQNIVNMQDVTTHSAKELLLTAYTYILVYECYDRKEELKHNGYQYDGKERAWKKKLSVDDIKFEINRLSKAGFKTIKTKSA